MNSNKVKSLTNIFLATSIILLIVSYGIKAVQADISNPHPIPPTNSVTAAMLKSGIISDSKVSTTASIALNKTGQTGDVNAVHFGGATNTATSSNLSYFTSSSTLTVLGNAYITGTTTLNGVAIKFPATRCLNNQTFKEDGKGNLSCGGAALHTFSKLTSTSTTLALYTVPAGANQLIIRMVGAGGGGTGNSGTTGVGNGTNSNFGTGAATTSANGGQGGTNFGSNTSIALGGTGGLTSVGTERFRVGGGSVGDVSMNGSAQEDGAGANSIFGGRGVSHNTSAGTSAAYLSGAGVGAGESVATAGQGGAAGEYVEFIINTPAASYLYNVGAGGAAGTSGNAGGKGGDGVILIEEVY